MSTNEAANDRFGYDRYMVVAMAPDRIERQAAEIRETVEQNKFKLTIPCHVTVVPSFYGIDDLDAVKAIVQSASSTTPKPYVSFNDSVFEGHPEFGTAGIELFHQDELLAFQHELEDRLSSHISGFRYPKEWMYRKHMNYVIGLPDKQLKTAVELGRDVELGDGFSVERVQLRARSFTGDGEDLHVLGEYPLSG